MKIDQFVKSYFNGFSEIRHFNENTKRTNALAIIKLISYLTILIPCLVGVMYLSSLRGRVQHKESLSPLDKKVDAQREKIYRPPTPPAESPVRAQVQESLKRAQQTRKELDQALAELKAARERPVKAPEPKPAQVKYTTMADEIMPEILSNHMKDIQESIGFAQQRWEIARKFLPHIAFVVNASQDPKAFYINPQLENPFPIQSNQVKEYADKFQKAYIECVEVMVELDAGVRKFATAAEAMAERKRVKALTDKVRTVFNLIQPVDQVFRLSFEPLAEVVSWLKNVNPDVRKAMVQHCNLYTAELKNISAILYKP